MNMQKIVTDILEGQICTFDPKEGMIQKREINQCGYHSKMNGVIHHVRDTAGLASGILLYELEQHYEIAFQALHRLCDIQDTRIESPTFGLWSYYLEEDLEHMIEPDYNWANFIGRELLTVCILCKDKLPADLEIRLHRAIQNAMQCTIKRNVAADYTNISLMSNMTLVSAGELLQDEHLFHIGKDRLMDSPDLTAYTYKTPYYSMGSFAFCDCWNQRRNAMIIWDKDAPKTFRLRSIHNNYDFCSGVVHSQQENNRILGHMGLVSDRGSFIYTLDKVKNGYTTDVTGKSNYPKTAKPLS